MNRYKYSFFFRIERETCQAEMDKQNRWKDELFIIGAWKDEETIKQSSLT